MNKYFELAFDGYLPHRVRHFGDIKNEKGVYILAPHFWSGQWRDIAENGPITVELYRHGKALDYWETYRGIPIVSKRFIEIVSDFDANAIEAIPVIIKGTYSNKPFIRTDYFIMNIISIVDCVDTTRTTIEYYEHDWNSRKGQLKTIYNVHFLADIVQSRHIFRPSIMPSILYVSETLRNVIENTGLTGMLFLEGERNWGK